jgi:gamma-glutamylcyclotransferase (GGCT)/AIG2-like uncharacterized protein YtfP
MTTPIFLYGTLMAPSLLSLLLTGTRTTPLPLYKATLADHRRVTVPGNDFPALIKTGPPDLVQGLLFIPRSEDDTRKLDNFEGDLYSRENVTVYVSVEGVEVGIEACTYVWCDEGESNETWDFEEFVRDGLDEWLDSFEGLEFL